VISQLILWMTSHCPSSATRISQRSSLRARDSEYRGASCYSEREISQESSILSHITPITNADSTRDDPRNNRGMPLNCLKDSADNVVCPVKLVLVMALRTGNIKGANSIEKALQLAIARPSKSIVWSHPERPVISSFQTRGVAILSDGTSQSDLKVAGRRWNGGWRNCMSHISRHQIWCSS
jgi:hypothetical protein